MAALAAHAPGAALSQRSSDLSHVSGNTLSSQFTSPAGDLVFGQQPELGDRVLVGRNRIKGVLRFAGETQFAHGEWVGIELDTLVGKNDGSVQGVRYFFCAKEGPYGIFVRPGHTIKAPAADGAEDRAMQHPPMEASTGTPQQHREPRGQPPTATIRSHSGRQARTAKQPPGQDAVVRMDEGSDAEADAAGERGGEKDRSSSLRRLERLDWCAVGPPLRRKSDGRAQFRTREEARRNLAQSVEDLDLGAIHVALPEAQRLGVPLLEVEAAMRLLTFETQRHLLCDMDGLRAEVRRMTQAVEETEARAQRAEQRATAVDRSNAEARVTTDELLRTVGDMGDLLPELEARIWRRIDGRTRDVIEDAVADATQQLAQAATELRGLFGALEATGEAPAVAHAAPAQMRKRGVDDACFPFGEDGARRPEAFLDCLTGLSRRVMALEAHCGRGFGDAGADAHVCTFCKGTADQPGTPTSAGTPGASSTTCSPRFVRESPREERPPATSMEVTILEEAPPGPTEGAADRAASPMSSPDLQSSGFEFTDGSPSPDRMAQDHATFDFRSGGAAAEDELEMGSPTDSLLGVQTASSMMASPQYDAYDLGSACAFAKARAWPHGEARDTPPGSVDEDAAAALRQLLDDTFSETFEMQQPQAEEDTWDEHDEVEALHEELRRQTLQAEEQRRLRASAEAKAAEEWDDQDDAQELLELCAEAEARAAEELQLRAARRQAEAEEERRRQQEAEARAEEEERQLHEALRQAEAEEEERRRLQEAEARAEEERQLREARRQAEAEAEASAAEARRQAEAEEEQRAEADARAEEERQLTEARAAEARREEEQRWVRAEAEARAAEEERQLQEARRQAEAEEEQRAKARAEADARAEEERALREAEARAAEARREEEQRRVPAEAEARAAEEERQLQEARRQAEAAEEQSRLAAARAAELERQLQKARREAEAAEEQRRLAEARAAEEERQLQEARREAEAAEDQRRLAEARAAEEERQLQSVRRRAEAAEKARRAAEAQREAEATEEQRRRRAESEARKAEDERWLRDAQEAEAEAVEEARRVEAEVEALLAEQAEEEERWRRRDEELREEMRLREELLQQTLAAEASWSAAQRQDGGEHRAHEATAQELAEMPNFEGAAPPRPQEEPRQPRPSQEEASEAGERRGSAELRELIGGLFNVLSADGARPGFLGELDFRCFAIMCGITSDREAWDKEYRALCAERGWGPDGLDVEQFTDYVVERHSPTKAAVFSMMGKATYFRNATAVFNTLDKDRDGHLTRDELREGMRKGFLKMGSAPARVGVAALRPPKPAALRAASDSNV